MWRKTIYGQKLKKSLIPEKIFEDITLNKIGAIITNQEVIANRFDDFFINVAGNLLKKLGEKTILSRNNGREMTTLTYQNLSYKWVLIFLQITNILSNVNHMPFI